MIYCAKGGRGVSPAVLHNGFANSFRYSWTSSRFSSQRVALRDVSLCVLPPLTGNESSDPIITHVGLNPNETECWYRNGVPRIKS